MRDHLERVLAQTSWNISRTAALLGVSRNTVMARIARFGSARSAQGRPAPAVERPATPAIASWPAAAPGAVTGRGTWERRRLTFVRVVFPPRPDADVDPSIARFLDVAGDKLRAFGARLEGGGASTALAVFGLDDRDEPAVLAGHGALVVRNAARQGLSEATRATLRVGLHTAERP